MSFQIFDYQLKSSLPEYIECQLEEGLARSGAFNRKGNLLAIGCNDGRIVIWDFDTKGISKVLVGHIHPITSLSWSRNGKFLLSSSSDWSIKYWDIYTGVEQVTMEFNSSILRAEMHPKGRSLCLVSPWMEEPYWVDLESKIKKPLPINFSEGVQKKSVPSVILATWNQSGDKIYTGDSKGVICEIDARNLTIERNHVIQGSPSIKSIIISRDEKQILVNCADKTLRLFNIEDFTFAHEMYDAVNMLQWKRCVFSSDGEYIIGGSAQKHEHKIYMWDRHNGQLFKFLEGPKEGIMDLLWHPKRPILVSISNNGIAYIWNVHYTENWSAYAPGFTELEENEVYIEREDEFDILDEEEEERKIQTKIKEESVYVDILSVDKNDSDDENFYLPVCIIPDQYSTLPASVPTENDTQNGKRRKRIKVESLMQNY